MSEIKLTVNIPTPITITNDQLLKILEKALRVDDYTLIDDVLHRYDRVSHNDYDYVPVKVEHEYQKNIVKKLKLLAKFKEVL